MIPVQKGHERVCSTWPSVGRRRWEAMSARMGIVRQSCPGGPAGADLCRASASAASSDSTCSVSISIVRFLTDYILSRANGPDIPILVFVGSLGSLHGPSLAWNGPGKPLCPFRSLGGAVSNQNRSGVRRHGEEGPATLLCSEKLSRVLPC